MRVRLDPNWFLIFLAGVTSCALPSSELLPDSGVEDCSVQSAMSNLRVQIRSGTKAQRYTFESSKIVKSSDVDSNSKIWDWNNNPKRNVADFEGRRFQTEFPSEAREPVTKERLAFPAAYSPDKRSFVAAVINVDSTLAVIEQVRASRVPRTIMLRSGGQDNYLDSIAGFSVYTLTWNRDSERVAVIEMNYDRRPRSPMAAIAPDGGVVYSDVVLRVYKVPGTLLCQSLLVSKAADASVAINWQ